MVEFSADPIYNTVIAEVEKSKDITVAVDENLNYIAVNETACAYLKVKPEALLGKSAIQLYPEIIASRNHRNMLRARSGEYIPADLVESRMGDILKTSYTPVIIAGEVRGVILNATLHTRR